MLYRPCLIKLIAPDNPYHLREQELPFFITLAHEFLHALNQLERIDKVFRWLKVKNVQDLVNRLDNLNQEDALFKIIYLFNKYRNEKKSLKNFWHIFRDLLDGCKNNKECILKLFETILPIQKFLMKKLSFQKSEEILQSKYKFFWQNGKNDDSLDEMTVILGSKRKIALRKIAYISETLFLQEFYNDSSIISWSHFSAHSIEFWKKMVLILEKSYVSNIITYDKFGLILSKLRLFSYQKYQNVNHEHYFEYTNRSDMDVFLQNVENTMKHLMMQSLPRIILVKGMRMEKVAEKIEKFEILQSNEGITLLPKYSKHIVLNNYKSIDLSKEENNSLMGQYINFPLNEKSFQYFQTIMGQKKVLVIVDDERLAYKYWLSDKHPTRIFSEAKNLQKVLENNYNSDIMLYYNGICFQKIVIKN